MSTKTYAQSIIKGAFNGVPSFCRLTGFKPSTVQYWVETGRIPEKHRPRIIEVAHEHEIELNGEKLSPIHFVDAVS